MYCKECGKELSNDSKFCSFCGTKLGLFSSDNNSDDFSFKNNDSMDSHQFENSKSFKYETVIQKPIDKYDNTYEGDSWATIIGIIVILLGLILLFAVRIKDEYTLNIYKAIAALINLFWRVIATTWIVHIAKRQNRKTTIWGILGFIVPNLVLIIIGSLKKLLKNSNDTIVSVSQTKTTKHDLNEFKINENVIERKNLTILNKITYEKLTIGKTKNILDTRDEMRVEFSDGKKGILYFSHSVKKHYFKKGFWAIYYLDESSAIDALHFYLSNNQVLNRNRYYFA